MLRGFESLPNRFPDVTQLAEYSSDTRGVGSSNLPIRIVTIVQW